MEEEIRILTLALRRGDEPAWRAFHAAYHPRLFRWLLAVAHGDAELAAEAAHLAFLRAVRGLPVCAEADELWRRLTRLARCAYLDEWRKRHSRRGLLQRWLSLKPAEDDAPAGFDAAFSEEPEDGDPLVFLEECLAALPPEDRLLLEEKYLSRKSVCALAADRSLSDKALESRLTRARERLRSALTRRIRHAD